MSVASTLTFLFHDARALTIIPGQKFKFNDARPGAYGGYGRAALVYSRPHEKIRISNDNLIYRRREWPMNTAIRQRHRKVMISFEFAIIGERASFS